MLQLRQLSSGRRGHSTYTIVTLLSWRSSVLRLSPSSTQWRQDASHLVRLKYEHKETAWPRVTCTSWTREGHPSKSCSRSSSTTVKAHVASVIGVLLPMRRSRSSVRFVGGRGLRGGITVKLLNSRPGSSANPFLHRPFPLLPDWLHGLSDHLTFLLCSTVVLV